MVLYGGQSNAPSTFYDDTWEFDGSTWTQVTTPGLGNRSYHAMAFDGSSNQTVLFGGATDNFPLPVDTWAYPEPNVHSTFCVMGSGNGSDWAWSVNSATWDVTELSTGGVVGSPEVVADFFAGQINAAGCSGLAAAALPGTSCFNVTAGGSQPFSLCVGPALAPPACCVAAGSVCPFNPDLVLLSDTDCNKNGEDDAIDIYLGLLPDANGDGIPDNCTGCAPASCADEDGDGIRDDNCVHAACVDGACVHTAITFAEMGGAFGDCAPDGAADANDRFHALNCFSDTATDGSAGYPCEAQPPHAYNVDAGGSFGDCDPDGVCDGHDAFHALNAFSGATVCSCSPGPSPGYKIAPRTVDATGLAVVAPPGAAAPGVTFEVDVYIDGPLNDLRGYQLHLGVAGGRRGRLDLIDITIHPRQDHVFAGAEHWSAFNTATGQMVAGRDGPGVATAGRAYLATFIYQASADAAGVFTIDMLHSEADPAQRTFMFPTQSDGRIAIDRAVPAEILVRGRKR
jgi:hypothetical protein